ncbi:MAG: HAMP domain-containing histidine kinase [Clostridiales bacterium]|nr:HAMP domain-containing histidine kinase [Clostridiales bacterium]
MKDFFRSFFGKGLLYAAVLISIVVLVLSGLGAFYMYYSNYYTQSEEYIREDQIGVMVRGSSANAFYNNFDTFTGEFIDKNMGDDFIDKTTSDDGNFIFRITDADGNVMVKSSTTVQQYQYKMYLTVLPPHQTGLDEYQISGLSNNTSEFKATKADNHYAQLYIVESAINPDLKYVDEYKLFLDFHHFLYSIKTSIYIIGVLAFIAMIVSFIALMSVAGRRPKKEEIVPWYFHKVPFDVITAALFCVFCLSVMIIDDSNNPASAITLIWVLLIPLYCMSIAVRIKTKTFITNNVIFMILKFLWKCLKSVGKFLLSVIMNMKILWKVILVFAGLMLFWGIAIAAHSWRFEAFLMFLTPFTVLPLLIFIALQLDKLKKGAQELAEGHFDHVVETKGMLPELKKHAINLNSMASAQKIALEEKLKSERMKTELITNVSHDIKTPLTSIINYADLISKEEATSEKTKEYSEVLIRQSVRLKRLLEDLVEASKASTGNLEVDLQPCDAQVFVTQSAGEYEEKFKEYNLTLITNVPEQSIRIMADGRRMQRIFDNLMNNACKYSLPGTRVYVDLSETDKDAVFTFKNTSKEQLNMSEEELMERFTRGDSSRNTEGSGLGLSIAGTLAELQNGKLRLTTDGDLFKATLTLPKIKA